MLLKNQMVKIRKQGCKIVQYYLNLGYTDNDGSFVVKAEDLPKGSHTKIDVKCDYCDTIKNIAYKDYIRRHDNNLGDCCHKCEGVKYKSTMNDRYSVDNAVQLPDTREKTIATNREKYGVDWGMQSSIVLEKSKATFMEKYGVERPLQVEEFVNKSMKTRNERGNAPISKPQKETASLLKKIYGNCELEVVCGRCSLDCVVEVGGYLIDVEYDGWYWHQDPQRDKRRDNFVKKQGYKVLRIKGGVKIPTEKQLMFHIDRLLSGHTYSEIIL